MRMSLNRFWLIQLKMHHERDTSGAYLIGEIYEPTKEFVEFIKSDTFVHTDHTLGIDDDGNVTYYQDGLINHSIITPIFNEIPTLTSRLEVDNFHALPPFNCPVMVRDEHIHAVWNRISLRHGQADNDAVVKASGYIPEHLGFNNVRRMLRIYLSFIMDIEECD